jgi:hypothetical protein
VATTRGVDPFLKATLLTHVLRHHGLSLHQRAPRSSPYDTGAGSHTPCKLAGTKEAKPPRAERVTAQRLQALLHLRLNQWVKGRTAMQAACNCTTEMHPFDFDASSMEAQAHTSCNWRASCYVRKTAPPLTPMSRLLDYGTGATTRGNLRMAHQCQPSASVTSQSAARKGTTVDMVKSGPAVMAAAGGRKQQSNRLQAHVPSWGSKGALSHGVKTTRPCSVPRTARATAAPRTTRPVALTPRQCRRHLWQAKRTTLHLRHNDRVKKGAPHRSISYPFPLPLSLSCYRDWEKGYSERGPSLRRKRAPSPPTDQRFEGWPLGRVRQPPQSTRAPRPLLVRGLKAGPSEGFDSRLSALGLRAHY